jgi:hypothetical protein
VNASAISIPPFSANLVQLLSHRAGALISNVGKPGMPMETLIAGARNAIPELDKYSTGQIEEALLALGNSESVPAVQTEREQRSLERRAIIEGRTDEDGRQSEFVAEPVAKEELPGCLADYFDRLVKVHRLREVRALRGFCRVDPPAGADSYKVKCAPLAQQRTCWLPAVEVRGEGIYLELDPARVFAWEQLPAVIERQTLIRNNFVDALRNRAGDHDDDILPTARQVLLHTLAHLLMRQLSLECGYSSASLRERLYVNSGDAGEKELGLLIYTATTGADGTLGGLVRQGGPQRFGRTLLGALEGARWCSSDPLCIESRGQGADALNLAACHACCLVSETSCELRNLLLDRALLIGTPEKPDLAFFGEVERML